MFVWNMFVHPIIRVCNMVNPRDGFFSRFLDRLVLPLLTYSGLVLVTTMIPGLYSDYGREAIQPLFALLTLAFLAIVLLIYADDLV